jgi:hypothetical protein
MARLLITRQEAQEMLPKVVLGPVLPGVQANRQGLPVQVSQAPAHKPAKAEAPPLVKADPVRPGRLEVQEIQVVPALQEATAAGQQEAQVQAEQQEQVELVARLVQAEQEERLVQAEQAEQVAARHPVVGLENWFPRRCMRRCFPTKMYCTITTR